MRNFKKEENLFAPEYSTWDHLYPESGLIDKIPHFHNCAISTFNITTKVLIAYTI